MTNEPDVRHGVLAWPNTGPPNMRAVHAAAEEQAQATVGPDDRVFDLQFGTGRPRRGDDSVMEWPYSFQVIPPGGSAAARPT